MSPRRSLFVLAALVVACDQDSADAGDDNPGVPACAIAERECQQLILDVTARVRGDDSPEAPVIRTLSRAEYEQELMAESAERAPNLKQRALGLGLSSLGLVSADSTLQAASIAEQVESTAAYYRTAQQDVTIISDAAVDKESAMNALSHELTHYLQDLRGQLAMATVPDLSLDESVARRAVAEGEAVVTSFRVSADLMGLSADNVRWTQIYGDIEDGVVDAINASSSPLLAAENQLPYVLGPEPIETAWNVSGRAGVDRLFDHPPTSVLEWLRQTARRHRFNHVASAAPLKCYPALPPRGYNLLAADTLGVSGVLARLAATQSNAVELAASLQADRLAIYLLDDDTADSASADDLNVIAVWRLRFPDADQASAVQREVDSPDVHLWSFGEELLFVTTYGSDAAISGLDLLACPTQDQFTALAPQSQRQ